MKILVTADWHLDASTGGMRRLDDVKRAVVESVDYSIRNGVGVYLFLGDLMDPDCGSRAFACLEVAIRAALALASNGIESHWIAGNHDVIEDGSGRTTLTPMLPLEEYNRFKSRIYVHESSRIVTMMSGSSTDRATLLTLPYAPLARSYDPTAMVAFIEESKRETCLPLVIAGHMTEMPGIVPGSETKDMARGRGMAFPFDACEKLKQKHLMLNGHFHDRQTFKDVHIPGSLERLTFGEERNEPGWLVCEV